MRKFKVTVVRLMKNQAPATCDPRTSSHRDFQLKLSSRFKN
jgi:hypothetical protein